MGEARIASIEMGADVTGPTKRPPREKKVPPGTMKTWSLVSVSEDDVAGIKTSLNFMSDYNRAEMALKTFRAQCEADGKDPFERLAHVVAHNYAVGEGTRRGKQKGPDKLKAKAYSRHAEIAQQLKEAAGSIKAVAIDRQSSAKVGSSERTLRRVKGQLKATKI